VLYDNTTAATSGHFVVAGNAQAAQSVIIVTAAQLAQTTFVAGSSGSDDLFVAAWDGKASSSLVGVGHGATTDGLHQTRLTILRRMVGEHRARSRPIH
jgi:hypothetical protein